MFEFVVSNKVLSLGSFSAAGPSKQEEYVRFRGYSESVSLFLNLIILYLRIATAHARATDDVNNINLINIPNLKQKNAWRQTKNNAQSYATQLKTIAPCKVIRLNPQPTHSQSIDAI